MSEERLERLEGMMSQLITMVGNLHNSMSDMQKDMKEMQTVQKEHGQKFESIELRMDKMETKNELRHQEVLNQIKRLEKDQDFIWEKTVRNERELEIMKRTLES
jgi:Sec-independent protein translocase protein TatA